MNEKSPIGYLVAAAAIVVVIAGMKAAQSLVVPFFLAAFLAVLLTPPMHWLERRRVPTPLALLIIVMTLGLVSAGVFGVVGNSITDFSQRLPDYQDSLRAQVSELETWVETRIKSLSVTGNTAEPSDVEASGDGTSRHEPVFTSESEDRNAAQEGGKDFDWLDPEWAMGLVKKLIAELGQLLSNATVILITVIFMLLEASRFPAKLQAASGQRGPAPTHVDDIIGNVRRYMAIKTTTSLLTGALVTVLVVALGLDFPLLWGMLAFLCNYVPNIGSILAAFPAVVLALVADGPDIAAATACGYLAINCVVSYAVEPRFMGRGLGLSTLVVFLSLVFWGWVLGPVGMLLSAPLTMIVKIILEDFEKTRWIAILLSSRAPEETV